MTGYDLATLVLPHLQENAKTADSYPQQGQYNLILLIIIPMT